MSMFWPTQEKVKDYVTPHLGRHLRTRTCKTTAASPQGNVTGINSRHSLLLTVKLNSPSAAPDVQITLQESHNERKPLNGILLCMFICVDLFHCSGEFHCSNTVSAETCRPHPQCCLSSPTRGNKAPLSFLWSCSGESDHNVVKVWVKFGNSSYNTDVSPQHPGPVYMKYHFSVSHGPTMANTWNC